LLAKEQEQNARLAARCMKYREKYKVKKQELSLSKREFEGMIDERNDEIA
jgi:hypothetical protein